MATMADVARKAGVSLSTVSYALSGERPISPSTRERVQRAMEELDYAPNAMARGLASRRSGIVAMLVPESETDSDPFMTELIMGASEAAREHGRHLLLWTESNVEDGELATMARQGLVDGALLLAVRLEDERVDILERAGLPFALVGRNADFESEYCVDADTDHAADLAIGHLVELGHQRIAFIAADLDVSLERGSGLMVRVVESMQRSAGEAGVVLSVHSCDRDPLHGRSLIRHLTGSAPDVTAAVVLDDPALGGILAGVRETGRSIPGDFSVLGFLASGLAASLTTPRLTTVTPSSRRIGQRAAQMLIDTLNEPGRSPSQELVPAHLVIRDSTGPAPAAVDQAR